ncbi:MAG: hypothetical protein OWU84_00705 [Firmicutes bacterium]|nr:hypothetical protein [Bacillota bacterium]
MKATAMIFRLSFLVALVIGLGGLFHFLPMTRTMVEVHIVVGLMMLVSIAWLAWETKSAALGVAAVILMAAGALPLVSPADPLTVRLVHLVMIIVAVAVAEMGLGQATRHRLS